MAGTENSTSKNEGKKAMNATPLCDHPKLMTKEDMAKVLLALESNLVMARDANGNYFNEVTPKIIIEAIAIMQSAIEKIK